VGFSIITIARQRDRSFWTYGSDWRVIEGDSDSDWVEPVYFEVSRVLKPNSLCCTFYGWPHAEIFLRAWKRAGLRQVSILALVKQTWGLGYFTRSQH
jgi:site-specific DNA-methyltransferase (adenine-specific)